MHRCAAYLDRADRVQCADRRLERFQVTVLVGEHAELRCLPVRAGRDTQADAGMDVLLAGLEPRVALRLCA